MKVMRIVAGPDETTAASNDAARRRPATANLSPANLLGPGPRHSLATTKASKVSGLLLCSPGPSIYHAFLYFV